MTPNADITETITRLLISFLPIVMAITFHEASHGYVAYRLGDPTAKMLGRLTLNPIAHIDLFGTILVPIFLYLTTGVSIGWAKPVPISAGNFRNPKRDMALSAAAGPLTNIVLALLSILLIRFVVFPLTPALPETVAEKVMAPLYGMLRVSAIVNSILAVFNMIPLPPLDGGRVAVGILPHRQAFALSRLEPYGFMIVILLFFVLDIGKYLYTPVLNCVYKLISS